MPCNYFALASAHPSFRIGGFTPSVSAAPATVVECCVLEAGERGVRPGKGFG